MPRRNSYRASADIAHQDTQSVLREIQARAHRQPQAPFARGMSERDRDRQLLRETVALVVVSLIGVALLVGLALYPQFANVGNLGQP